MADEHTGGMLALVPDNADQLAIDGGEPVGQLHLTLLHLGDVVTDWPPEQAEQLRELITASAPALDAVEGRIIGPALFNPDGGPDGDRDPCLVLLVGDAPDLGPLRDWARWVTNTHDSYPTPPAQFEPYLPHIAVSYAPSTAAGVSADGLYTGPVRFGTLRLALAGDVLDVPLGSELAASEAKSITFTPPNAVRWAALGMDGEMATRVVEGKALDSAGVAWVAEHCRDAGREWADLVLRRTVELKVASPDPRAARLREYWAHGAGRKKWMPGTPGDFKRLRRQLRKYVKTPRILNGLTANIHKLATGEWPGPKAHSVKSFEPDVDESALMDGIDDWGFAFDDDDADNYLVGLGDDGTDDTEDVDPRVETARLAALGARLVADTGPPSEGTVLDLFDQQGAS